MHGRMVTFMWYIYNIYMHVAIVQQHHEIRTDALMRDFADDLMFLI